MGIAELGFSDHVPCPFKAVSYTHLDVYKRQALKKSALNRAQGFRNPKVENRYLDTFTESLRERFKGERIKKSKKAKKADK